MPFILDPRKISEPNRREMRRLQTSEARAIPVASDVAEIERN
jgi:hypothetical protein